MLNKLEKYDLEDKRMLLSTVHLINVQSTKLFYSPLKQCN